MINLQKKYIIYLYVAKKIKDLRGINNRKNKGGSTLLEIMTNEAESSAKIIVIGVGGAGNNAVNRMVEEAIGQYFRLAKKLPRVLVQARSRKLDRRRQKRASKRLNN